MADLSCHVTVVSSVARTINTLNVRISHHEEVSYWQPLIPPKRFDIFSSLTGGCSEGLGAF